MANKDIKTLIKILEDSKIDELEVSTFWGQRKIRVKKGSSPNIQNVDITNETSDQMPLEKSKLEKQSPNSDPNEIIQSHTDEKVSEEGPVGNQDNNMTLKAPLVGTFYNSPKPDSPPYISEGDIIKEGQILYIIEAMKIFNEIESEHSGKIIKILVKDATPVEYDQDILIISSD